MALGQASVLPGLGGSGPVEVIFFLVGISYLWGGCHVTRLKMASGPEGRARKSGRDSSRSSGDLSDGGEGGGTHLVSGD